MSLLTINFWYTINKKSKNAKVSLQIGTKLMVQIAKMQFAQYKLFTQGRKIEETLIFGKKFEEITHDCVG